MKEVTIRMNNELGAYYDSNKRRLNQVIGSAEKA
jgi:hypothetical protein